MNNDFYYANEGTGFGWIVRSFTQDIPNGQTTITVERGYQGGTSFVNHTIQFNCNNYDECADHLIQYVSGYELSTGPISGGGFPIKH